MKLPPKQGLWTRSQGVPVVMREVNLVAIFTVSLNIWITLKELASVLRLFTHEKVLQRREALQHDILIYFEYVWKTSPGGLDAMVSTSRKYTIVTPLSN